MFTYHKRELDQFAKSLFATANTDVFKVGLENAIFKCGYSFDVPYEDDSGMETYDLKNSSTRMSSSGSGGCSVAKYGFPNRYNPVWKRMTELRRHESLVEKIPGMESQKIKCRPAAKPKSQMP